MDAASASRIKSAMIVYELEVALGNYVSAHKIDVIHDQTAQEILRRNPALLDSKSGTITQVVVENSYLAEVFGLAISSSTNLSDNGAFRQLEVLAKALGLFEIRNAISHPNRPFPPCYWYRCAALASDPSIHQLDFVNVSLALQNAESGVISVPPDDWTFKKRWSIPADLPSEADFSVTGLIGRAKEEAKLAKDLRSKRAPLVAIVAKGGIGKTSLMQQAVQTFCLSADTEEHFDAVVWASLKQEELTVNGVRVLTAPASIRELESSLCASLKEILLVECSSFAEAKSQLIESRILLCLDNLETMLRDNPKDFSDFYEELPESWRVVVTSRIPVDGAKNVALEALDKSGAIGLARSYIQSRSGSQPDNNLLERIASGSENNPLAIKLTADRYLLGDSLEVALQRTEEDVLVFSFTALMDYLSQLSVRVLEAIFALENPTRTDLCSALEADLDEIAEAVGQLAKVSLITRKDAEGEEELVLQGAVRDLLRGNPRDLETRSRAAIWSAKSRESTTNALRYQTEVNASPLSVYFLRQNTPAYLIETSRSLRAAARLEDRARCSSIERELRQRVAAEPNNAILCKLYAQVVKLLSDTPSAIGYFSKAAALDPTDPSSNFSLLQIYQEQKKWEEARDIAKSLIDKGWGEPVKGGATNASRLWGSYLHSLNILREFNQVIELTSDWEERMSDIPALGLGRAAAYRRLAGESQAREEEYLGQAAVCFFKLFLYHGLPRWALAEYHKLFRHMSRHFSAETTEPDLRARMYISNLLKVCMGYAESEISDDARQLLAHVEPQASPVARTLSAGDLTRQGFVIGKVKTGLNQRATYFFVRDHAGVDYYVNRSVLSANGKSHVVPGMEVALKFDPESTGNALRATQALIL